MKTLRVLGILLLVGLSPLLVILGIASCYLWIGLLGR